MNCFPTPHLHLTFLLPSIFHLTLPSSPLHLPSPTSHSFLSAPYGSLISPSFVSPHTHLATRIPSSPVSPPPPNPKSHLAFLPQPSVPQLPPRILPPSISALPRGCL
eukprot:jgi/Botrbrau1/15366/Bobra.0304s0007.1